MKGANNLYVEQLASVFNESVPWLSDINPADWTEANVIMQKPFPGPFRYDKTPYTREIVDCMAPWHPARRIAVMKGAQIGFSAGVIIPACGWMMKNNPGNTVITVGNPELIEPAMQKLDLMIDAAGLRGLIKPQVIRARNNKSGDTNYKKEFANGYIAFLNASNHKGIRQLDLQNGFFDDFEAVKRVSKESGSTLKLLEQRFAAYGDTSKIFFISTPELEEESNILEVFLLGDQRKFLIPCEHCHCMIELVWSVKKGDIEGGITWKPDHRGKAVPGSVGYICQECGGFFNDKRKHQFLNDGYWHPTAEPSEEGFYSYQISSLYAPLGMDGWAKYVNDYIGANPKDQPRDETKYQTFVNVGLGLPYRKASQSVSASSIQKNAREYAIGSIPEELSIADGNGPIRLLTCAIDMNGKPDDARLDFEILAWSDSGANYSVAHGSIGTFIPLEGTAKVKADRAHWTYEFNRVNSVWPELDKLLLSEYKTDGPNSRAMKIYMSGLDCGHFSTEYAYPYLDSCESRMIQIVGLKGDKESTKPISLDVDKTSFKPALVRPNLYILQVGILKDDLSKFMQLRWDARSGEPQPPNFMNYPEPSKGLYGFTNFFVHYEAEERIVIKTSSGNAASIWRKKSSSHQNHMWDCRVYNLAVRDILVSQVAKALQKPKLTWRQFMEELFPR